MLLSIIIDVVLLVILALFIIGGYKKGFVKAVSGIIALVIAFYGAGFVAGKYSHNFTPMLEPFISGIVDKSVAETREEYIEAGEMPDEENELDTIGMGSLLNLGIFRGTAAKIIEDLKRISLMRAKALRRPLPINNRVCHIYPDIYSGISAHYNFVCDTCKSH